MFEIPNIHAIKNLQKPDVHSRILIAELLARLLLLNGQFNGWGGKNVSLQQNGRHRSAAIS